MAIVRKSNRSTLMIPMVIACVLVLGLTANVAYFDGEVDPQRLLITFANNPQWSFDTSSNLAEKSNHAQTPLPGWKSVDLFYGKDELGPTKSRSQAKQDVLVLGLLGNRRNGYFVDLAANDAVQLSNTFILERQNDWMGICVEPNPMYWSRLAQRKCHHAAAVVSKDRLEQVNFKMMTDKNGRAPSGGIEELMPQNVKSMSKEKAVKLYTVQIQEILEKYDAPKVMEYLSLDVEGAEYLVMKDFPFDKYKFIVMTVERPTKELMDLLYEEGYRYLAGNNAWGQETAWYHKDFENLIQKETISEHGWLTGTTKWIQVVNGNDKPVWKGQF